MSIGFKGGVAIAQAPEINIQMIFVILLGVCTGFTQPFIGYFLLKRTTNLDPTTASAVAAHYGSISMVTFATAVSFLELNSVFYAGYIAAVLALMEAPAILTGLFIAHKTNPNTLGKSKQIQSKLIREIFTNGAILLLTGSFLIGCISGQNGMEKMQAFLVAPFQGLLAFFLLDMGILVARQMHHVKEFSIKLILFGIYMPIIGCLIGALISYATGLDIGTGFLFMTLVASSSYIAVTAAMRLALPQAKVSVYVPMTLAITFPFNVTLGIPFYFYVAQKILT